MKVPLPTHLVGTQGQAQGQGPRQDLGWCYGWCYGYVCWGGKRWRGICSTRRLHLGELPGEVVGEGEVSEVSAHQLHARRALALITRRGLALAMQRRSPQLQASLSQAAPQQQGERGFDMHNSAPHVEVKGLPGASDPNRKWILLKLA